MHRRSRLAALAAAVLRRRRRDHAAEAAPHQGAGARAVPSPRAGAWSPAPRLAGFARRLEMEAARPLGALRFRNVGPEIQGGRIVDIEGIPSRPDALLVAFASGGLWRTDNRGGSWTPLFDRESSITIGDIAIADRTAPGRSTSAPARTTPAARRTPAPASSRARTGASTWANVGLADSHHIGRDRGGPREPGDRATWPRPGTSTPRTPSAASTAPPTAAARGTACSSWTTAPAPSTSSRTPRGPEVLYAATWERARTAGELPGERARERRSGSSTDAGARGRGSPAACPRARPSAASASPSPASRPDTVYAVVDNQSLRPEGEPFDEETPPGELTAAPAARCSPRTPSPASTTRSWAASCKDNEFPKALDRPCPQARRQGGQDRRGRRDRLPAGRQPRPLRARDRRPRGLPQRRRRGSPGAAPTRAAWRRSTTRYGYYFGRIARGPHRRRPRVLRRRARCSAPPTAGKTWKGLDERGVHVDHHALFVDPRAPHRLALGNDGGLNLSFDHGETWTKVNNLPVGQFTTLALDNAEPYNILGGLQDNGVMRGPSTYNPGKSDPAAWKTIYGGDGSAVVPDPKDANIVYTAYQFGNAVRLNLKSGERDTHPPAARALRGEEGEAAPLQLGRPLHPVPALAGHPVLRRQPPLPLVRPRRHLDADLRGPHLEPRAGRRPLRHDHPGRGVAEAVRRSCSWAPTTGGSGAPATAA